MSPDAHPGSVVERAQQTAAALMIAEAGRTFASSLDLEVTISNVGRIVVGWFADWCVVELAAGDGRYERVDAATSNPDRAAVAKALLALPLEPTRAFAVAAVRADAPVLVAPVTKEQLVAMAHSSAHLAVLRRMGMTSYIAAPLIARGRRVGGLLIASTDGMLTPAELHVAGQIASLAAAAIDNARTYAAARAALTVRDSRLAVVAHDLRTPIANMVLAAGLLQLRLREAGSDGLDRLIAMILTSAEYMDRLVGDLTDVAHLESGTLSLEPASVAAVALLDDAVAAHGTTAGRLGIGLTTDCHPDAGLVRADRARVFQVLSNLLANALKFTAAGGSVRLEARPLNGDVHFTVTDTGRGIPREMVGHIFEAFWRHDERANGGLGLGLTIARTIVELHGGRIRVESEPGVGTSVHFTLPSAERID